MANGFDDPLQRYQIMERLGQGGHGTTFRGIDRSTGASVAIKVLSLGGIGGDWKLFDRFEREVAVLRSLNHPGIPRYIDSYSSEATGDYFLVMELIQGTPLSRRMRRSERLEPATILSIFDQALAIIEYLHSLSPPVIHRDIKPANMLLDPKGRLFVVDFGGVRQAAGVEGGTTMIGTFGYMAPEQLHGESGPGTDLYALGATMVALHAGAEAETLPRRGLHIDVDALAVPSALAPALHSMLEPDPTKRVKSVAQVRRRLQEIPSPAPPRSAVGAASEPQPLVAMDGLRGLARLPAPFSIIVWIFTALAAGGLTVFQVVLLPLIIRISHHVARHRSPRHRAELTMELERMSRTVVDTRQSLSAVASQTHPLSDTQGKSKSHSER